MLWLKSELICKLVKADWWSVIGVGKRVMRKLLFQSRVDSLKDVNLALEDDVKALRLKMQQIEDDYYAARNELDDARCAKFCHSSEWPLKGVA